MTVDPRLLCDQRTAAVTQKLEDLERSVARLNGYVSDLLVLYSQVSGRQLPDGFGRLHYARDLGETARLPTRGR